MFGFEREKILWVAAVVVVLIVGIAAYWYWM